MDLGTRKKLTEEKLKKAFRLKLLELGKTKIKKASPDMFNYRVVLTGHDKVSDTGRAKICRCKFKAPSLQYRVQKQKDHQKTWVSTGKPFEDFRRKKNF